MATKKYTYAVGRRKTAVAQVRLYKGKGTSNINGKPVDEYITRSDLFHTFYSPLKIAGVFDSVYFEVKVSGSGQSAQADAIKHGLARALLVSDENLKGALRGAGLLTRDARKVERKKPGLKKARKSPSWSKR
ncbi:30S ribosomal protein S9 [Candidatus Gracilibacteria bacterium]|nr:MAG: 30S ribosomal protein S9 [Candidatus Gracilibacteria bacterium]